MDRPSHDLSAAPSAEDAPHRDVIAAEALLRTMRAHGMRWFFLNPGTDFPSIVEAYSRAQADGSIGTDVPLPVVVPHENAAMAMAHGAYLATGLPQAVMVHVSVGTANTVCGAANAGRDQAPLLIMAGRTPITETGRLGSRNRVIHWAQEMFDQGGMLREFVKWDMELMASSETAPSVQRAVEVMMAHPRGPAYLALPRETLGEPVAWDPAAAMPRAVPAAPHADPAAIAQLAQWVAAAKKPLILTGAIGRTAEGVEALAALAERFALPVVTLSSRYMCLPTDHAMHLGFQTAGLLEDADLVISLECDVPWMPSVETPPAHAKVVHLGVDPAFTRYPTRGFRSDLSITAEPVSALKAWAAVQAELLPEDDAGVAARRQHLAGQRSAQRARWKAQADGQATLDYIAPEYATRCLHAALSASTAAHGQAEAVIVNEYPLRLEHCPRETPGTFFGLSPAGGLGWGLGAAVGMKIAQPERLIAVTLGDGAYMFDNPTACHWVSNVQKAPVLAVVYNNQMYGAVRNSTASMYKAGQSADNNCELLAHLSPPLAFEKVVEAAGGYGERVEHPADLPAALERCLHAVQVEGRQALLNIVCKY